MYGRGNPLQKQSRLQARGYGPLKAPQLSVTPMGWWDKYLPSIMGIAAGGAAQTLNFALPGLGAVVAPVAQQGAKLGTQKAMGQDVGKKELIEAGTAAGTGAASAGVGLGIDKYSEHLEKAREAEALAAAQANADFDVNLTDLQKAANVTSTMPTAEADHRTGLLSMQDRLQSASGGGGVTQAGVDEVFSPGVASQRPTSRQLGMLRKMNPDVNIPEPSPLPVPTYSNQWEGPQEKMARMGGMPTNEQQWGNLSTEQKNYWRNQQSPMPAPMPTSGGGNLQSAMPVAPPTTPQTMLNPLRQTATPPSGNFYSDPMYDVDPYGRPYGSFGQGHGFY